MNNLVFLEDCKDLNTEMSIGITNLLSNITTKSGSHKGGWARLLKCQLENLGFSDVKILDNQDLLSDFDVIIFDLGAEYSGAINLFGGLDEKVFKRLKEIKDFQGSFFSWRNELPDVTSMESRRTNSSTCEGFKQSSEGFLRSVYERLASCQVFQHVYRTDNLLIGDSHTPSVWTPAYMIERRDGRTLRGMIEHKTIEKYVKRFQIDLEINLKQVMVHCSSIDIRHHLAREEHPEMATANLVSTLIDQMFQIPNMELVFVQTMGIEDESRKLPKTGYFKGTPFYGSWELRNRLRDIFNAVLEEAIKVSNNSSLVKFPEYFFEESGKLKFDVMEHPGSVHLSPEHYRWDLDNNTDRWSIYKRVENHEPR